MAAMEGPSSAIDEQLECSNSYKKLIGDIVFRTKKLIDAQESTLQQEDILANWIIGKGNDILLQQPDDLLGECLDQVGQVVAVVHAMHLSMNKMLKERLKAPLEQLLKADLYACRMQVHQYEKAHATYEMAHLKVAKEEAATHDAKSDQGAHTQGKFKQQRLEKAQEGEATSLKKLHLLSDETLKSLSETNGSVLSDLVTHMCGIVHEYSAFFSLGQQAVSIHIDGVRDLNQRCLLLRPRTDTLMKQSSHGSAVGGPFSAAPSPQAKALPTKSLPSVPFVTAQSPQGDRPSDIGENNVASHRPGVGGPPPRPPAKPNTCSFPEAPAQTHKQSFISKDVERAGIISSKPAPHRPRPHFRDLPPPPQRPPGHTSAVQPGGAISPRSRSGVNPAHPAPMHPSPSSSPAPSTSPPPSDTSATGRQWSTSPQRQLTAPVTGTGPLSTTRAATSPLGFDVGEDDGAQMTEFQGGTVLEGILSKKGGNRRNWKERFFVLKPKNLFYFNSDSPDKKLKGLIYLNECSVSKEMLTEKSRKRFCFTISTWDRVFYLSAKDQATQELWISSIKKCIETEKLVAPSYRQAHAAHVGDASRVKGSAMIPQEVKDAEVAMSDPSLAHVQRMVSSERSYGQFLHTLVKVYMAPLFTDGKLIAKMQGKVTPLEVNKMFSNVNELYAIHISFADEIKSAAVVWPNKYLADVFLKLIPRLTAYSVYVSNYGQSLKMVDYCKKQSDAFKQYVEACEKKCGLTLATLLGTPLRHVKTYESFLARLTQLTTPDSHPDYQGVLYAYEKMCQAASLVSSSEEQANNVARLRDFARELKGMSAEDIIDPTRALVRHGRLVLVTHKRKKKFTDLLHGKEAAKPYSGPLSNSGLPMPLDGRGGVGLGVGVGVEDDEEGTKEKRTELHCFLFSDVLLFTKHKPEKGEFVFKHQMPLYKARLVLEKPHALTPSSTKTSPLPMTPLDAKFPSAPPGKAPTPATSPTPTPPSIRVESDESNSPRNEESPLRVSSTPVSRDHVATHGATSTLVKRSKPNMQPISPRTATGRPTNARDMPPPARPPPRPPSSEVSAEATPAAAPQSTPAVGLGAGMASLVSGGGASASNAGVTSITNTAMAPSKMKRSECAFLLQEDKSATHTLVAESPDDRQRWVDAFTGVFNDIDKNLKVFNVPIEVLMSSEREKGRIVPLFIQSTCDYLRHEFMDTEGIFRVSGSVTTQNEIRDQLDRSDIRVIHFSEVHNIHDVTGLLKLWFRELPEPPTTYARFDDFIKVGELTSVRPDEEIISRLKELIHQLPMHHRNLLQYFVKFLLEVTEHQEQNRMSIKNTSIVFAPTLLSSPDVQKCAAHYSTVYTVMETILVHYDAIFGDIERSNADVLKKNEATSQQRKEKEDIIERKMKTRVSQYTPALLKPRQVDYDKVVKDGYMLKKGGDRRNWKSRWFVLKYKSLIYYKKKDDDLPQGRLNLVNVMIGLSTRKRFCFLLNTKNRTYFLVAHSDEDRQSWMDEIGKCIVAEDETEEVGASLALEG